MIQYHFSDFDKKVHHLGQLTGWIALALMLAFPFGVSLWFGIFPDFQKIILPIANVSLIMFVACIGELMAYPPILGAGSLYMSNVSGNTSNLKIPCAITAIRTAKIETGTPAANAVSMVAVGVSTIATTILILLSLFFMKPLTPVFESPILQPAFNNVLPALFGGLAAMWILPNAKLSIVPLCAAAILGWGLGVGSTFRMPLTILISLVFVYYGNKKAKQSTTTTV